MPDAPKGGGLDTTLVMSVTSPAGDRLLPVTELSPLQLHSGEPPAYVLRGGGGSNDGANSGDGEGGGCGDGTLVRTRACSLFLLLFLL